MDNVTFPGFVNDDREDGTTATYLKTPVKFVDYYINGIGGLTVVLENGDTIILYSE